MRIDQQLEGPEPSFSVELFPPKSEEARQAMLETVEELGALEPDFFSVTYGAVGATREGTIETVTTIKQDFGFDAMAHLSCVGETTEGLRVILDFVWKCRWFIVGGWVAFSLYSMLMTALPYLMWTYVIKSVLSFIL